METRKSRVAKVIHNLKQFESKFGTMYVHEVAFDNGDKGEYNSKTDTCQKFVEGQEADYTIETTRTGNYTNTKIKHLSPETSGNSGGGFSGGKKSFAGNESFALSYAKDLACAHIEKGKEMKAEQVIQVAEAFYQWLQSKKA